MNNLFKRISGYLAGVIIVALVLMTAYGYQKLYTSQLKITDLKAEVVDITAKRDALKTANDSLAKELAAAKVTKAVIVDTKDKEVKIDKAATEASKIVNKRLAEIEAKYAGMEKNDQTSKMKAVEISLERAKGIWLTYCLQEPAEKACK